MKLLQFVSFLSGGWEWGVGSPLLNLHLVIPPRFLPCLWAEGAGAILEKEKGKQKREVVCHKLGSHPWQKDTGHKGGRYVLRLSLCPQSLSALEHNLLRELVGHSEAASFSAFHLPVDSDGPLRLSWYENPPLRRSASGD